MINKCNQFSNIIIYQSMSVDFTSSFSIRPDTPRVSQIQILSDFIEAYPDLQLTPNLRKLGQRYKYYRPICGDGNCFYRACVFLYFSTAKLDRFTDTFPPAPIKDCVNLPFDLQEYDVGQVLNFIWKAYLLPIKEMDEFQRRKELLKRLNSSVMLDAFLIAYFRSLNHQYLSNNRQKFVAFIEGNVERQLASVLNFGRQSQGIQLFAMAELLKVKITIMMVHKENFQRIVYMEEGKPNYVLFLRPGHYDILCEEAQYHKQGSSTLRASSAGRSTFPSNYRRQADEDVVRINSIEDLGKYGKGRLSEGHKSTISRGKPTNMTAFYEGITKHPNKKQQSIRKSVEDKGERQPSPQRQPSKQKIEDFSHKKNDFQPTSISIPNVSKNKLLFELSVLLTVIGLICGTAYYT